MSRGGYKGACNFPHEFEVCPECGKDVEKEWELVTAREKTKKKKRWWHAPEFFLEVQ